MVSRYIADCFMPCHADKRMLDGYMKGSIHRQWESHWDTLIGTYFDKDKLLGTNDTLQDIIDKAKDWT